MKKFAEKIQHLNKQQLIQLSCLLQDEILAMRPEELDHCQDGIKHYDITWKELPLTSPQYTSHSSLCIVSKGGNENDIPVHSNLSTANRISYKDTEDFEQRVIYFKISLAAIPEKNVDVVLYIPTKWEGNNSDHAALRSNWLCALALSKAVKSCQTKNLRLWFVTRSSQPVLQDEPRYLDHYALHALGKSLCLEMPEQWGASIDVDEKGLSLNALYGELSSKGYDEISYRGGKRYVPFVQTREFQNNNVEEQAIIKAGACYIVTGGMGGIGLKLVESLIDADVSKVIVLTRRSKEECLASDNQDVIQMLDKWNERIDIHPLDILNEDDVRKTFSTIQTQYEDVKGIFHAAGVNDVVMLENLRENKIDDILCVKTQGTLNLHKYSQSLSLDFQVYFSSMAAHWGTSGMSVYAIANRFLEGFSRYCRNTLKQKAVCIAWGPWDEVGMLVKQNKSSYGQLGLGLLKPALAIAQLWNILSADTASDICMTIDWDKYLASVDNKKHKQLFALFQNEVRSIEEKSSSSNFNIGSVDAGKTFIWETVSEILGHALPENASLRPFQELGLSSISSIELSQRIERETGIKFKSTVVFDYPRIDLLGEALFRRLEEERSTASEHVTEEEQSSDEEDAIAIVGIGCRLPGAENIDEFWQGLMVDEDRIEEFPDGRFDISSFYSDSDESGKSYTLSGAYLGDLSGFDHGHFGISYAEAKLMDPQQRIALETVWRCFESAGLDPWQVKHESREVGVYFGIGQNEYGPLCRSNLRSHDMGLMATGQSMNIIAGRVSYIFGFKGPAVTVDTACSSSLMALDQAVQGIRSGKISSAVVGGVNALVSPETFVLLSKANALSRRGKCVSFDESADGYVRSEGCVAVWLKPLQEAKKNNLPVYGVIRGIASNHDGVSSSLTAPNGKSQEIVMKKALKDADLSAAQIDLVEAHGTGTPLGDPIEYHSIAGVYGEGRSSRAPLYLTSVKSYLGHMEAASGLVGLLKLVMNMGKRTLNKQHGFTCLNPHIDAQNNIVIPEHEISLGHEGALFGAVSSFGFSGTNVHVIVESNGFPEHKANYISFNRVPCWYSEETLSKSSSLQLSFNTRIEHALPDIYSKHWDAIEQNSPLLRSEVQGAAACWLLIHNQGIDFKSERLEKFLSSTNGELTPVDSKDARLSEKLAGCTNVACYIDLNEESFHNLAENYQYLHRSLATINEQHSRGKTNILFLINQAKEKGILHRYAKAMLSSFKRTYPQYQVLTVVQDFNQEIQEKISLISALESNEEHIEYRKGQYFRERLDKLTLPQANKKIPLFSLDASYLVTGGLGSIGFLLIKFLLSNGARHIVNINRSVASPEQESNVRQLEEKYNASIRLLNVDLKDRHKTFKELDANIDSKKPVKGVFCCAGMVDDGEFNLQSWVRAEKVIAAKYFGAWHLHRYVEHKDIDHFVLFSSLSSLLGNAGQTSYCVANALLDELAELRRSSGLPTLSINWGPWSDSGMTFDGGASLSKFYQTLGITQASADEYLAVLASLLESSNVPAQVAIATIDWSLYQQARGKLALLERFSEQNIETTIELEVEKTESFSEIIEVVSFKRRANKLQQLLKLRVAESLGVSDVDTIDASNGFASLGVDSLHAISLRKRLEKDFLTSLPDTLLFDYPSIERLAEFFQYNHLRDLFVQQSVKQKDQETESLERTDLLKLLQQELAGIDQ